MRGQSSAEMLILIGAILIAATSVLYLGTGGSESAAVMRAARDGAENAIAGIDAEYGCSIDIEELGFSAGTIRVSVAVRNAPEHIPWENLETIIKSRIREGALKFIFNAIRGTFPRAAQPVKTAYYTYDVAVEVRRVTR